MSGIKTVRTAKYIVTGKYDSHRVPDCNDPVTIVFQGNDFIATHYDNPASPNALLTIKLDWKKITPDSWELFLDYVIAHVYDEDKPPTVKLCCATDVITEDGKVRVVDYNGDMQVVCDRSKQRCMDDLRRGVERRKARKAAQGVPDAPADVGENEIEMK